MISFGILVLHSNFSHLDTDVHMGHNTLGSKEQNITYLVENSALGKKL